MKEDKDKPKEKEPDHLMVQVMQLMMDQGVITKEALQQGFLDEMKRR